MRFNPSPYSPEMPDLGNYGLTAQRTEYKEVATVSQGSSNRRVVGMLHEALESKGRRYLTNAGGTQELIDGKFGPKTKAAVKAFQKANGLSQDGVVGPNTWAALGEGLSFVFTYPNQASPPAGSSGSGPPVTASGDDATRIAGTLPVPEGKQGITSKKWFWPVAIGGGVLVLGLVVLATTGRQRDAIVTTRPRLV